MSEGPVRRSGLGLVLLTVWTLAGCAGPQAEQRAGPVAKQAVGDFRLKDLKGEDVRLSDFAGRVVLVSFWATWCEPCQIELPRLQEIWERHRDQGLVLLTISADTADKESDVRQLVRRYRYRFPVLLDQSSQVTDRFQPSMELPYSMLLDRQGRIASRHQGYRPGDEEVIEREIVQLLAR